MKDYADTAADEREKNAELIEYIEGQGKGLTIDGVRGTIERLEKEYDTSEVLKPVFTDIDEIAGYKVNPYKVSDTFAALNEEHYNLIRNGLFTVGAEANTGKSSFLSALALDIMANDRNTAFLLYSIDDSTIMAGKRILCQLFNRDLFRETLPDGYKDAPQIRTLEKVFIQERLNIHTIARQARQAKEHSKCRNIIIGIDYLQIIPNDTGIDLRFHLNDTVKRIKEYQKELEKEGNCIVILLSQMNRDKKSGGFRYRETSEIENQSDVCLDIDYRDDNTKSDERIFKVMKNKMGKKGQWYMSQIGNGTYNFTPLQRYDITNDSDYTSNDDKDKKKTRDGLYG